MECKTEKKFFKVAKQADGSLLGEIPEPIKVEVVQAEGTSFLNGYNDVKVLNFASSGLAQYPYSAEFESPMFDLNPLKTGKIVASAALKINYSDSYVCSFQIINLGELLNANNWRVEVVTYWMMMKKAEGSVVYPTIQSLWPAPGQLDPFIVINPRASYPWNQAYLQEFILENPPRYFLLQYRVHTVVNTVKPKIEFDLDLGRYPI